jgi:hypothetical protein
LLVEVGHHPVCDVAGHGNLLVGAQLCDVRLERHKVRRVGSEEAAAGALEPDGQDLPPARTLFGSVQLPNGTATLERW